jgi:hypothetical protein
MKTNQIIVPCEVLLAWLGLGPSKSGSTLVSTKAPLNDRWYDSNQVNRGPGIMKDKPPSPAVKKRKLRGAVDGFERWLQIF